jgi:hypothetical protein
MADSNSAFATVQPLQANVSDFINNQERMDFAYRDEARKLSEMKRVAQEREGAKKDALLKEFQSAKQVTPSGIASIDSFDRTIMNIALEDRVKLYKKKVAGGLSVDEEIMYAKLGNIAGTLELMSKAYSEEKENYYKRLEKGEIQRDVNYEMKMQEIDKSAVPFIDSEGNPAIGIDNDGDGKPDVITFSLGEGLSLKPNYVPDVDFTAKFQELGSKLGSKTVGTDKNFTKNTIINTPLDMAELTARSELYNANGSYTDTAKSELNKIGFRDLTNIPEEVLTGMQERATQLMMATRPDSNVTDVDNSSRNTANKNAKDDKDKITYGIVTTPPTYEKGGYKSAKGYGTIAIQGTTSLEALTYFVGKEEKTITNANIQSYTVRVLPNGVRQIVAEITYQDTKGQRVKESQTREPGTIDDIANAGSGGGNSTTIGKQNKVKIIPLTEKDAKIFALQMGFKSVNEMKDAARSGEKEDNTQTSGTGSKYND